MHFSKISFFILFVIWGAFSACDLSSKTGISQSISVDELPPLPGELGFGGPFAGTHNGVLIVAGGANFPEGYPWEGGKKVWYDHIFVLEQGASEWIKTNTNLPFPIAYGGSISTPEGLILIGGSNQGAVFKDVIRLSWDAAQKQISIEPLASLPEPSSFLVAGQIGTKIYVVPGYRSSDPTDIPQEVWTLDWSLLPDKSNWEKLPGLPGPARAKVTGTVQSGGGSKSYLYCFSGEIAQRLEPDSIVYSFSKATYRFDPEPVDGKTYWTQLSDSPQVLAASSAIELGQSHILIFGGDTGEHRPLAIDQRPEFTTDIFAYHSITDSWVKTGNTKKGVVTTTVTRWNGDIILPSGEIRPGVRTPMVQQLKLQKPKNTFGTINFIVLFVYLALLILLGFLFSKRNKDTNSFFLAGQRIPWWAAGLSIFATQLSAITFIAIPAVAFTSNWLVYLAYPAIFILAPIVIYFYLPFFRRLKITTAYEYLEKRFNVAVRLFGSSSFILFQLARMAIVVYLPALALATATGMNVYTCIAIMAILSTLYTVLGGIEAVIWTDVLQTFVLVGGTIIALILIIQNIGGLGSFYEAAQADNKWQLTDWRFNFTELVTVAIFVGSFFINFGPYTTDQAVIQRYLTTKDEKAAAKGIWLNGIIALPAGFLFFLIGTAMFVFYKSHPESLAVGMQNDEIFPLFISTQLPAGLSGLLIAGIFAASMSSLDSSMHSIATVYITDFHKRFKANISDEQSLRLAKILVIIFGLLAMLLAAALVRFDIKSLFFFFQKVLGLLGSGLTGIFILGVFTKRATSLGALTGAGLTTLLLAYIVFFTDINFYWYATIGIPFCVITGYLFSFITPPSTKSIDNLTL